MKGIKVPVCQELRSRFLKGFEAPLISEIGVVTKDGIWLAFS